MTNDEYLDTQGKLSLFAVMVRALPLDEFIKAATRGNEIGPYVDPTNWSKAHRRLDRIIGLARAFANVKHAERQLLEQLAEEGDEGAKEVLAEMVRT